MSTAMNSVVAMILNKRARDRREDEYRSRTRSSDRPLPPLPRPIPIISLVALTVDVLNKAAGKEEWALDWSETLGVTVTHEPTDVSLRVLTKDEVQSAYYAENISEDDVARSYARQWTEYARREYANTLRIDYRYTFSGFNDDWWLSLRNGDIIYIPGDGEFWVKPLRAIVYSVSPHWLFLLTEKGKELSISLPADIEELQIWGKEVPVTVRFQAGTEQGTIEDTLVCPICGQHEALDCMAMHAHSHLDWIRRKEGAGPLAGSF